MKSKYWNKTILFLEKKIIFLNKFKAFQNKICKIKIWIINQPFMNLLKIVRINNLKKLKIKKSKILSLKRKSRLKSKIMNLTIKKNKGKKIFKMPKNKNLNRKRKTQKTLRWKTKKKLINKVNPHQVVQMKTKIKKKFYSIRKIKQIKTQKIRNKKNSNQ